MTNEPQSPRASSGRPGAPMGSTVAIVIAAVAVLLGLFVLKKFSDDDEKVTSPTGTTLPKPGTSLQTNSSVTGQTVVTPVQTTLPAATAKPNKDVKVVVTNASQVGGAAAKLSAILVKNGFATGKAVNTKGAKNETSVIYFDTATAGAKENALIAARIMGLKDSAVQPMPATVPTDGGKLEDGAGVLISLGLDKAGKSEAQLTGAAAATTATTGA